MQSYHNVFAGIIHPESLFRAWESFRSGKGGRADVREFECGLERNIFALHRELRSQEYRHGPYQAFTVCDPKPRRIHKAGVRDRIVHHAVFAALEPLFDPSFFAHSYSCRKGKGTHRAVRTVNAWLRQVSGNGRRPCFALQCDVHRFFESVSHPTLLDLVARRIHDPEALRLVANIVGSFATGSADLGPPKGLPLGNLTSQLFANIYLGELDQFLKHGLRVTRYARYTDDFVIVSADPGELVSYIGPIRAFLQDKLQLHLHPRKVTIRKFRQGIDFLGYVLLPHHRVLRTRTRRRMVRRLREKVALHRTGRLSDAGLRQSLQSSLGVLSHADSHDVRTGLLNLYWFWLTE